MAPAPSDSARRQRQARAALDALGPQRSTNQLISVQCRAGHHVATVYASEAGPVYVTRTGPHGHGSRDFVDTGRHGSRGGEPYVDLLDATAYADDGLAAWCDCGPRTVSRRELQDAIKDGSATVRLP